MVTSAYGTGGNLHIKRFGGRRTWHLHAHFFRAAPERLVKAHVQRNVHIATLLRTRRALLTEARSAEAAAEDIVDIPAAAKRALAAADALENIRPAAGTCERVLTGACAAPSVRNAVFIRRSILVVELALLFVAQHFVGLVDFFELGLVAAGIGMVRTSKLAVRLLYLIGGGGFGHAENLVIIRCCCHDRPPSFLVRSCPVTISLLRRYQSLSTTKADCAPAFETRIILLPPRASGRRRR